MTAVRPRVYLDLDRTIFDTDKAGRLWDELAKHYALIPEACFADRDRFYERPAPNTYYHDMSAQLVAYGIYPEEAYARIRESSLANGSLPVVTTCGEKRRILETAGDCWLVDDRVPGDTPPPNVRYIQVVPPGGTVEVDKPWPVCENLKEVKEYLYDALH